MSDSANWILHTDTCKPQVLNPEAYIEIKTAGGLKLEGAAKDFTWDISSKAAAGITHWRHFTTSHKEETPIDLTPTQEDKNKLYGSTREEIKSEDMLNAKAEHTGLSVGYYSVVITTWTNPKYQQPEPVVIECNDIIEALNMNYACGNVFKAIWRICAAAQGKLKKGNDTIYDAEKAVFFSNRIHEQHTNQ